MHARLLAALCALVFTTACLENEEEITIRADGSASVRLSSEGAKADMSDGYPIPLGGPWLPANLATEAWLQAVGNDTGSASVRAAVARLSTGSPVFTPGKKDEVRLEVRAEFARVEDLPATYAPASEPYAAAFLQRATSFTTRHVGTRTVHVFERRLGLRPWERFDVWARMKGDLDDDIVRRMSHEPQFTEEERQRIVRSACGAIRDSLVAFASDALGSEYVDGAGELPAGVALQVHACVSESIGRIASETRVRALLEAIFPTSSAKSDHDVDADLKSFDTELRDGVRACIASSLERARVSAASQRLVERELERLFTSYDHSNDLGDDAFVLVVHMPGTVVGGNADSTDGSTATWKFSGESLRDRERVLRAVSVVE